MATDRKHGRQPVAKGGIWDSKRPEISEDTKKLLNTMMEESRLTNFQRRHINKTVKSANTLPSNFTSTSSRQQAEASATKKCTVPKALTARQLTSGKRRKEVIDALKEKHSADGQYVPKIGKQITDQDKEKLQNMMAYGSDLVPKKATKHQTVVESIEIDRFQEVLSEIEERKAFLQEMEGLGRGSQYRSIIATEIAQKIQELVKIDKEKSKELENITGS